MNKTAKVKEAEQILAQALVHRSESLTSQDIAELVNEFRPVLTGFHYQLQQDEIEQLIKSLETQYETKMGEGVSLINYDIPHDEEWYQKRDIGWAYWEDYQRLLVKNGLPPLVVSSMNSVTDKILGLLQDPLQPGDWERRGLVIGHVQSGKTSNYIGVLSKAADAGYKFIIVIAGIHNSLRTQTQERIDEGFIGRDSLSKEKIGAGALRIDRPTPVTVTTTESDFNKVLARSFGMELTSLKHTFILVIKKNVKTLSNLFQWLKELNTRADLEKIADIPMLLIDDEADNASINTNKPDLDPTRTNQEIRRILNLFRKRCYVGYTATPFANIFIDPDDDDAMLGHDLFPAHFIHCLDAPTNYFGAERLFLDEESNGRSIVLINDAEDWFPLRHKNYHVVAGLPESLKQAIRLFVLSRAIRNIRGQAADHASMLVNVSRFVSTQREVKQLIQDYVDQVKRAIRFNYRMPQSIALTNIFIEQFFQDFLHEYATTGVQWDTVLAELDNAADSVKVHLVNSKSDETLQYSTYAKEGNALTTIVIGGLSLSRGLTLEGLTVSYIYRNSIMYDTLMQMGRWFGYRDGYEDLCRVFMPEASQDWYTHIAEATEELRMQIKRMRRERKKPSDFGLYVRAHPDTLIVTALNKMRHTESKSFRVSYDGKLLETHIVPSGPDKTDRNRRQIKAFFTDLQKVTKAHSDSTTSYYFKNVPWDYVLDFVLRFGFHEDLFDLRESVPSFIKEISDLYPQWDVIYKSVKGRDPSPGFMIAAQRRTIGYLNDNAPQIKRLPRMPLSEQGWYVSSKNRISGNTDFRIGLQESERQKAFELAIEAKRTNLPIFRDYTNARGKPVLMVHLLDLFRSNTEHQGEPTIMSQVPALSISFPNSDNFRTVDYVVGKVWLKQFEQDQFDSPDQEDDYDLETE